MADDGVDTSGVDEETTGSRIDIDINDRVEDEGCGNIHKRAGVQDRRAADPVAGGREESQPITLVTVLFIPEPARQSFHPVQDGTATRSDTCRYGWISSFDERRADVDHCHSTGAIW